MEKEKAQQIAEIIIQSPRLVHQLGLEIAERVRKGIHTDTDVFWAALELVQKAGVDTKLALLYIEDAVEDRIVELLLQEKEKEER